MLVELKDILCPFEWRTQVRYEGFAERRLVTGRVAFLTYHIPELCCHPLMTSGPTDWLLLLFTNIRKYNRRRAALRGAGETANDHNMVMPPRGIQWMRPRHPHLFARPKTH